jgi:predicted transcriptional regulator YdeE
MTDIFRILNINFAKNLQMENFKIIGISTETSNQNNQAAADLGKLWERFFAEEIASKIPNKENEDIYAIYTDYESDYTGRYTTIIGQRVSTLDHIPDGFVGREIKNERLIKYKAKGEMPRAVVDTWQEIWANDIALYRTYNADFEVYGAKSQQGSDSEVEIYIGVRS